MRIASNFAKHFPSISLLGSSDPLVQRELEEEKNRKGHCPDLVTGSGSGRILLVFYSMVVNGLFSFVSLNYKIQFL